MPLHVAKGVSPLLRKSRGRHGWVAYDDCVPRGCAQGPPTCRCCRSLMLRCNVARSVVVVIPRMDSPVTSVDVGSLPRWPLGSTNEHARSAARLVCLAPGAQCGVHAWVGYRGVQGHLEAPLQARVPVRQHR